VLEKGKPREWRRAVRWIDLYGHSDDLMEVLSNELELPEAIIDDVSLEQLAKITFFPEDKVYTSIFVLLPLTLIYPL
jgi:Mg2+ and Co2+ transporter CorA